MKVAVATRTCDAVSNYWGSDRFVDANKSEIVLTCFNSLVRSIVDSGHDVELSIHDDNSSGRTLDGLHDICKRYNIQCELYQTGELHNFKSQYDWASSRDCDYVYCVEDDYLHRPAAISTMVETCERAKDSYGGLFAIFPFNSPHRYASFEMLYPSYIIKNDYGYWRSSFHSTHTFFLPNAAAILYDEVLKFQAYSWPDLSAVEDETINKVWREQHIKLLTPLNSLAYHIADDTQRDDTSDWATLWIQNFIPSK